MQKIFTPSMNDRQAQLQDCLEFIAEHINSTPKYQREAMRCIEVALHILKQMKDELEADA